MQAPTVGIATRAQQYEPIKVHKQDTCVVHATQLVVGVYSPLIYRERTPNPAVRSPRAKLLLTPAWPCFAQAPPMTETILLQMPNSVPWGCSYRSPESHFTSTCPASSYLFSSHRGILSDPVIPLDSSYITYLLHQCWPANPSPGCREPYAVPASCRATAPSCSGALHHACRFTMSRIHSYGDISWDKCASLSKQTVQKHAKLPLKCILPFLQQVPHMIVRLVSCLIFLSVMISNLGDLHASCLRLIATVPNAVPFHPCRNHICLQGFRME